MRRGFTIHHNGPPANCVGRGHQRCLAFWAAVKAFHTNPEPIGKGWSDIAYSFGVCPHGERLPGRGWDKDQFANGTDQVGADDGPNRDWYSVLVFVGGGPGTGDPEEIPTREMVVATAALIEDGRRAGRCGSAVRPHSDWKPKPCPGPTFLTLSRQWDGEPITIDPPEDDMTPEDHKAIAKQFADLRTWTNERLGYQHGAIVTGSPNRLANPSQPGWGHMASDPAGLNDLRAQIAASGVDVDEAALAAALAPVVASAVLSALPDEVTDHVSFEDVERAVVSGLGKVRLTPAPS